MMVVNGPLKRPKGVAWGGCFLPLRFPRSWEFGASDVSRLQFYSKRNSVRTHPETNSLENGWLEDKPFFFGMTNKFTGV